MIVAISIEVILCILGIAYPKSKRISFLIMVYMWIFYALNTYSGDYEVYEALYRSISGGNYTFYFEPLFSVLMFVSAKLGLPFIGFKCILATVFMFLLSKTIQKYTVCSSLVLTLYMIFPFLYFTSVLRAGIASLIFIYCFEFLYKKNSRKKYVIGMIVACLFHYSSCFFFLFLLSGKKISASKKICIAIASIFVAILYYKNVFFYIVSSFTTNPKIIIWLTKETTDNELNFVGIISQIIVLVLILLVLRFNRYLYNRHTSWIDSQDNPEYNFHLQTHSSSVWLIVLIPLFFVTSVWMRLVWEFLLVVIIDTVNLICKIQMEIDGHTIRLFRKKPVIFPIILGLVLILNFYASMPYRGTVNATSEMYKNNVLFQLFPF